MKISTIAGKTWVVTSPNGCTVTQTSGSTTITTEVPDNVQTLVVAQSGILEISDDDTVVTEVFNLAPAPCRQGEGGGLPAGYKRLEYLESTGTQYIDTLFYLPPNVEAEAVLSTDAIPSYMFGNYGYDVSAYLLFGTMKNRRSFWTVDGAFSVGRDAPESFRFDEFFHLRLGLGQALFNGQTMAKFDEQQINIDAPPRTLALFARNHKNGSVTTFSSCCIRSFKLLANGRTLREYQPCLSPTGVPGMFDLVKKQFFSNLGTGDFLYPAASSTYSLRRVLPDWGKLTEHGLRRLYHAPANYKGELYDYALENGYKPIVEPEKPEEGYWEPRWRETEDEIVLEWIETEAPEQEEITHEA